MAVRSSFSGVSDALDAVLRPQSVPSARSHHLSKLPPRESRAVDVGEWRRRRRLHSRVPLFSALSSLSVCVGVCVCVCVSVCVCVRVCVMV